jgi:hypothetical protein
MVSELLLQSAGHVIRLFPAWPTGQDGKFSRLLAQGGFEVSAERIDDVIQNVSITSTHGGKVSLENPWPQQAVLVFSQNNQQMVKTTMKNQVIQFITKPGERYDVRAVTPP